MLHRKTLQNESKKKFFLKNLRGDDSRPPCPQQAELGLFWATIVAHSSDSVRIE